jgi:carbonic anhydrase/acetyltransferase-like protein (isoleucine patch superfamily)
VLGGGVMQHSINLVVGDPGVGKSTLVLQVASKLSQKLKILYVSGEESVQQVSARAKRLNAKSENLLFINEVNLENILVTIDDIQPDMLVLDSLQVVTSSEINSLSGSISQVRYIAEKMMQLAKQKGIPIFIIGHVNKGGELAGPMTLAHLVDAVLYLEGEKYQQFKKYGQKMGTLVHDTAWVASNAQIEEGSIICPFVFIGPNAQVSANCVVNVHGTVGHDVRLGMSTVVSPHADLNGGSGSGEASFIGAGAIFNPGTSIGSYSKVAAGAVVSRSFGDGFLLTGNPANGRQMFKVTK